MMKLNDDVIPEHESARDNGFRECKICMGTSDADKTRMILSDMGIHSHNDGKKYDMSGLEFNDVRRANEKDS